MPQPPNLCEGHHVIVPPKGVPVWDVDPYAPEILVNPAPYYTALRGQGAFAYIPACSILTCGGFAVTQEVFSDHSRFVSARGVGLQDFNLGTTWRPPSIILEADPPDHTKTRRVMMRAMSPRAVADLRSGFQDAADGLIDRLLAQGHFDAVSDLAEPFATGVFPRAVGMQHNDPRRLVDYGAMVFNALGPDNAQRRAALAKGPDIVPFITDSCARARLSDGGFGASIYSAADAGDISQAEAGMLVRSLLSAGVDTTVTALGNALWCLARNPAQFDLLRADPTLAKAAFDEVLRFTSPVHSFCRTAAITTQVAGVEIVEGTKILCSLGAANLDPERWHNADQFDITRRPVGHLAFGAGIHVCVGQNVARAELEAVLTALAQQVARIELLNAPVWRPNNAIHALDLMMIRLHRA